MVVFGIDLLSKAGDIGRWQWDEGRVEFGKKSLFYAVQMARVRRRNRIEFVNAHHREFVLGNRRIANCAIADGAIGSGCVHHFC